MIHFDVVDGVVTESVLGFFTIVNNGLYAQIVVSVRLVIFSLYLPVGCVDGIEKMNDPFVTSTLVVTIEINCDALSCSVIFA